MKLGNLYRELVFWKTERFDCYAMGNHYAQTMYNAVAKLLEISTDLVYAMTREELTKAIKGENAVEIKAVEQRAKRWCMALIDGEIAFYS